MKNSIALMAFYAAIYWGGNRYFTSTQSGKSIAHYLQNWRTDWVHGIICSITVFIFSVVAIFALALGLQFIADSMR